MKGSLLFFFCSIDFGVVDKWEKSNKVMGRDVDDQSRIGIRFHP